MATIIFKDSCSAHASGAREELAAHKAVKGLEEINADKMQHKVKIF